MPEHKQTVAALSAFDSVDRFQGFVADIGYGEYQMQIRPLGGSTTMTFLSDQMQQWFVLYPCHIFRQNRENCFKSKNNLDFGNEYFDSDYYGHWSSIILEWYSDGYHGKYWWNMMKIRCLSNGLYSLKNRHKPFGKMFRPPFGQCPNKPAFFSMGLPLMIEYEHSLII